MPGELRLYAGDDASQQPPDIPDVLLHETAVAWARSFFKKHTLKKSAGLADMERQFQAVLRDCGARLTANYAVDELCSSFPARLRELVAAKGGRLNH